MRPKHSLGGWALFTSVPSQIFFSNLLYQNAINIHLCSKRKVQIPAGKVELGNLWWTSANRSRKQEQNLVESPWRKKRRFFTALPAPNPLESASAWPCGIPPSSTWSRSPARQDCHSNHSPSCTAAPTDPRGSPCAPISGSFSSCHKRSRVKSRKVAAAGWKSFLGRV